MPGWTSPLLLRGLAAAGVFVVLVGGGVFLISRNGPTSHPTAKSAAPAGRPARPRPASPGVNLGSAGGTGTESLRYRSGAGFAYATTISTRANFSDRNLFGGVRKEIASSASVAVGTPTVGGNSSAVRNNTTRPTNHKIGVFSVAQLASCLGLVADGHPVFLADVARYLGKPAVIVVLKPVDKTFSVVVAGLACGTGGGDVLRRLSIPKG
jgi:hypothetical protein